MQYNEIVSSNKEPFQKLVCLFLRIRVDCFTQFVIWLLFALPCMHLQTQSCNRTTFFFNCKNNFQLNITFLGFKELINSNWEWKYFRNIFSLFFCVFEHALFWTAKIVISVDVCLDVCDFKSAHNVQPNTRTRTHTHIHTHTHTNVHSITNVVMPTRDGKHCNNIILIVLLLK